MILARKISLSEYLNKLHVVNDIALCFTLREKLKYLFINNKVKLKIVIDVECSFNSSLSLCVMCLKMLFYILSI